MKCQFSKLFHSLILDPFIKVPYISSSRYTYILPICVCVCQEILRPLTRVGWHKYHRLDTNEASESVIDGAALSRYCDNPLPGPNGFLPLFFISVLPPIDKSSHLLSQNWHSNVIFTTNIRRHININAVTECYIKLRGMPLCLQSYKVLVANTLGGWKWVCLLHLN